MRACKWSKYSVLLTEGAECKSTLRKWPTRVSYRLRTSSSTVSSPDALCSSAWNSQGGTCRAVAVASSAGGQRGPPSATTSCKEHCHAGSHTMCSSFDERMQCTQKHELACWAGSCITLQWVTERVVNPVSIAAVGERGPGEGASLKSMLLPSRGCCCTAAICAWRSRMAPPTCTCSPPQSIWHAP